MAGFLYYLPECPAQTIDLSEVAKRDGYDHLIGSNCDCVKVTGGPDGGNGLVVAVHPMNEEGVAAKCGFFADKQSWAKRGRWWVGFEKDSMPTPADVRRKKMIDGYAVELCGQQWQIPSLHIKSTLPFTMFEQEDGKMMLSVMPKYEHLAKLGAEWFERIFRGEGYTYEQWAEFAVRLIGINYRLGRAECLHKEWGLLDSSSETLQSVTWAATGMRAVIEENEAQKKILTQQDG